jgi:enhancing lycopene biosynthesis protein 2
VAREPPISPPRWAFQSIPGIKKGIAMFRAIKPAPSLRFAPIRLPIISKQPKRPKIIPDEPTATAFSGLKRNEVIEPKNNEVKSRKIYLFLPR